MSSPTGRKRRETGGAVMQQVLRLLQLHGIQARRRNTGAAWLPGKNGQQQLVRFGEKGDPDIELILPGGRAGAIECKATDELPTIEQFRRILEINKAGGFAFWCDAVDLPMQILPYAIPTRRIAYTSITQPVVAFVGEIVTGELTTWNGTEKQRRAFARKRSDTRASKKSRSGLVLPSSFLTDYFPELAKSGTTTNDIAPSGE